MATRNSNKSPGRTPRVTVNPLVRQYEDRHCTALDEIHRLVAQYGHSCVCMPHGMKQTRSGKDRQATDDECSNATIGIGTDLPFRVSGNDCTEPAADALERFGKELIDIAGHVRKFGKRIGTSKLKVRRA